MDKKQAVRSGVLLGLIGLGATIVIFAIDMFKKLAPDSAPLNYTANQSAFPYKTTNLLWDDVKDFDAKQINGILAAADKVYLKGPFYPLDQEYIDLVNAASNALHGKQNDYVEKESRVSADEIHKRAMLFANKVNGMALLKANPQGVHIEIPAASISPIQGMEPEVHELRLNVRQLYQTDLRIKKDFQFNDGNNKILNLLERAEREGKAIPSDYLNEWANCFGGGETATNIALSQFLSRLMQQTNLDLGPQR